MAQHNLENIHNIFFKHSKMIVDVHDKKKTQEDSWF